MEFSPELRARGFSPDAIRNFILNLGMSLNDIEVAVDSLYSENRKIIEPSADRYFFVDSPVKIKIENAPRRALQPSTVQSRQDVVSSHPRRPWRQPVSVPAPVRRAFRNPLPFQSDMPLPVVFGMNVMLNCIPFATVLLVLL